MLEVEPTGQRTITRSGRNGTEARPHPTTPQACTTPDVIADNVGSVPYCAKVNIVDPRKLTDELGEIFVSSLIAIHVSATFIVHSGLYDSFHCISHLSSLLFRPMLIKNCICIHFAYTFSNSNQNSKQTSACLDMFKKNVVYLVFGYNFCECRPILKIHLLADSQVNSLSICHREFHLT